MRTTIHQLSEHKGREVLLEGWLVNSRSSGKVQFLILRDGTGIVQAVVDQRDTPETIFQWIGSLSQETAVSVRGQVLEEKRAPGGYEIRVKEIQVIGPSHEYPITPKEHGIDFLLERRHLWLRSSRQVAILKIRHEIIRAIRNYLDQNGFVLVDSPILTPSACEGTTSLFEVNYFDEKAYLTQSGQLYVEAAAMAFRRVYCFGPTFRAEKSKTRRHLTEFWMVEPEMAYCDFEENLQIQEELVCHIFSQVLQNRREELVLLKRNLSSLESVVPPFPRISYEEALGQLRKRGFQPIWGNDLGGAEETEISGQFQKPVFITHFPKQCKAFYMKSDPQHPDLVLCDDLLAPEGYGEIIGGSQREDDLTILEKRMEEMKIPKEPYQWYLDLRRYGSVPHGGFGLGIERTVSWICGLEHVREAIPFPRTLYRIYP